MELEWNLLLIMLEMDMYGNLNGWFEIEQFKKCLKTKEAQDLWIAK